MQVNRQVFPLCFLTDFAGGEEQLLQFLSAGISWVQYRDKMSSRRTLYRNALRIRTLTRECGAFFIVNDYADIAVAVDADGLHLGQDDLPIAAARRIAGDKVIGISTHSRDEALAAAAGGADYIGFGPVFPTKTKNAGTPKGPEALAEIRRLVPIPIIAIGGITAGTCSSVLQAGASGVAVAAALSDGPVSQAVNRFLVSLHDIRPLTFW
ncbi:MAG TPA: thiamine phosphate synthase [Dissulfurispiraceae bacterium]|nr:thiamine phosphate synthase [Dissulfurispiraceae bacterium]